MYDNQRTEISGREGILRSTRTVRSADQTISYVEGYNSYDAFRARGSASKIERAQNRVRKEQCFLTSLGPSACP